MAIGTGPHLYSDAEARINATITVDSNQATRAIGEAFSKVDRSLGTYTTNFKQFQQSIDAATSRVTAFGLTAGIFFTVKNAILATASSMVEVEKGLADINLILNLSSRNLKVFSDDLFKVATSTGQTFAIAAKAATEFSRQGLGVEETLKRTRDALNLSRLAGIDAGTAVTDLTAAMNSFSDAVLDSTQVVSKFAAVDQRFAVSSADLAEAIKRVGSSAQDAGVPIDNLIGLVTALQERTARGGAVIGQSLKTIFNKVQNPGILDQLELFGIRVKDLTNHLLPAVDILTNVSEALSNINMPSAEKFKIENLIGSLYQINQVTALMKSLQSNNSTASQASGIAGGANTESLQRSAQLNQTLAVQLNRTQQNLKQTFANLGQTALSGNLQTVLGGANYLLEAGNKPKEDQNQYVQTGMKIGSGILKGLGDVLFGPLALTIGTALVRIAGTSAKSVITAIGSFTPLQSALKKNLELAEAQQLILQAQAGSVNNIVGANAARLTTERDILSTIEAQNIAKGGGRLPGASVASQAFSNKFSPFLLPSSFDFVQGQRTIGRTVSERGTLEKQLRSLEIDSQRVNAPFYPNTREREQVNAAYDATERQIILLQQKESNLRANLEYEKNRRNISGSLPYDIGRQTAFNRLNRFPTGSSPDIMSGLMMPSFHEDLMSGSTGDIALSTDINQRKFAAMLKDAARSFGGGRSRRELSTSTIISDDLMAGTTRSGNSAMRQLAIENPLLLAQANAKRRSTLQNYSFLAGFAAPIAGNVAAEFIPGDTQGGRIGKAAASGIGNIAGMAGTGFAIGGGPWGAIGGGVIGLLQALNGIFREMSTVLPEVNARMEKLKDSMSRREEIVTDIFKTGEQAEGFTSGRIPKTSGNTTNFSNKVGEISSRLIAMGVPANQVGIIIPAMLSGDPSRIENIKSLIQTPEISRQSGVGRFTTLLGQGGKLNEEGLRSLTDDFVKLPGIGGQSVGETLQSNPFFQSLLNKNTFDKTSTARTTKGNISSTVLGDSSNFEQLIRSTMGGDKDSIEALITTLNKNPATKRALIERLQGLSQGTSYIGQQAVKTLLGQQSAGKGINRDIDLERLMAASVSGGLNTRTEILAASAQSKHAGQFSILQASNQAALAMAGINQNPVQIETLRGKQALQELQAQGGLNVEKLNASNGGSLLKNIGELQKGFGIGSERDRFMPLTNRLASAAQDITLGQPGGISSFSNFLGGLQGAMDIDKPMFKKFGEQIGGIAAEFNRYQGSLKDLIDSQGMQETALKKKIDSDLKMVQINTIADKSLNDLNNSIIQDAATFRKIRDSGQDIVQAFQNFDQDFERSGALFNEMLSSGRLGKSAVKSLSESLRSDPITFAAQRDSGLLAQKHIQDYTLGLEQERVKFGALRGNNLLFSDQIASGQLSQDIGDVSTGKLGGKGVGKAMVGGFSNQLAFSVKDMYRDLIQGANDVGMALKSSFKDAFKSFLDGSQSASNALRSLGLSFANKLLDIAAQGTTNLLFGGLQNLGSTAFSSFSKGATGGYVTGGSGIRDDVPAMLNEGDFVLKQGSVSKYGVNFLNRLAGGGVALNPAGPLSNYAMSDETSVQNRLRLEQESANLNAIISYQQALDAYNGAKAQRRLGALINLGVAGVGAGIGYGARAWKNSTNAAMTRGLYDAPSGYGGGYQGMAASGGLITPFGVQRFAAGGPVDGVPALLTGGEYVVNRSAVSRLGVGFMHSLNRGDVPAYAAGGFVGESISTNTGGSGDNLNDSITRLINSNEKLRSSMEKGGGDTKAGDSQSSQPIVGNISINVSIDSSGNPKTNVQTQGGTDTKSNTDSADQGKKLGSAIQAAVLDTIIKETRNGGILEQNFQRRR